MVKNIAETISNHEQRLDRLEASVEAIRRDMDIVLATLNQIRDSIQKIQIDGARNDFPMKIVSKGIEISLIALGVALLSLLIKKF